MKHKPTPITPLDAAAASLGVWLEGWAAIILAFIGKLAPHWIKRDELNAIDRRLRALIMARASQIMAAEGLHFASRVRAGRGHKRQRPRNSHFRIFTASLLPRARGFAERLARAIHVRLHLDRYARACVARMTGDLTKLLADMPEPAPRDLTLAPNAPARAIAHADTS